MDMTPEFQEKAYQFGRKRLEMAKKKRDYEDLKLLFSNLAGYKDAGELEAQCAKKVSKMKRKAALVTTFSIVFCVVVAVAAAGAWYLTSPLSRYAFEENDDEEIVITGLKKHPLEKDGTVVTIPEEINGCPVVEIEALASTTMVELTLPESLNSVSAEAFANCPALTTIHFSGTASKWIEIGGSALSGKCSIQHEGIHRWQEWVLQEGYLCHEGGSQIRTCEVCLAQETGEAETREHTLFELPAVKATCTSTGLATGWQCEFCDYVVTPQEETAMAPHSEVIVDGVSATCTKTGLTDGKKCSVCGEITLKQEVIELKPHREKAIPGKRATCTETGLTAGKICRDCNTVLVEQTVIAMEEHAPVVVEAQEPTCSQEGHGGGTKCSVCGTILSAEAIIEKLPHTEEEIPAVEATCLATGLTAGKKCSVCGEITVEQQEIPKQAHTEISVPAVEATCMKTGLTEGKKCSVCGEITVAQEFIPKTTTHTEVTMPAVKATCTKTGLTEGTKCSVCGKVLVAQKTVDKIAHTEKTIAEVKATCTKTGLTEGKKCSVCGKVLVEQKTIAKTAHKETKVAGKAATCLATGLTEGKKCSVCNAVIVAQKTIAKTDHSYSDWKETKTPTCTAYGEKTRSCKVCNNKETERLDMIKHVYEDGYCKVCSAQKPSEGLTYKKYGDTYTVTGIGTCEDSLLVIPLLYEGCPVTAIGANAFKGVTQIASVVLPYTINTIGANAFNGCSLMVEINLPVGLATIGQSAFANCDSLVEIRIPDTVTSVGNYCFEKCYCLTDIYIGSGITTSATDVFLYCESVQQVHVESLEDYAVLRSKISYYSPGAVFVIGDGEEFKISSDKDQASGLYRGSATVIDVTFQQGVSYIADNLFRDSLVARITIPRTVRSIGDYAFYGCGLGEVIYEGTEAQWGRVSRGYRCFPSGTLIICTDGAVEY